MTTINTNVASMIAQQNLAKASNQMNTSLQRLSTGLQINSGSDNPAGLIASQALQSQMTALNSAISNATQANNMLATAEGAISQTNGLLLTIQGMVDTAASTGGMTTSETAANQLQIDQAVQSIDRIANTTQFNGGNLLDGTLGYTTAALTANVSSVNVNQATGGAQTVTVQAIGANAAVASLVVSDANAALANGTVTIQGPLGSATATFSTGMTPAQFRAAINAYTSQTGITATAAGATTVIATQNMGSSQKLTLVKVGGATLTTNSGTYTAQGVDAGTPTVNGSTTGVTANGLAITVNRAGLNATIYAAAGITMASNDQFNITGGGATFQVGAQINAANQVGVGISAQTSTSLGDATNGYLNTLTTGGANALSTGNFTTASNIVASAISAVSTLRGRIGAVQSDTLTPQIASLNTTLDNVTSANSTITDTNYAAETANMTRAQILEQAGTSVLAAANANPQIVLSLLKNL